ncbi:MULTISPECIES: nitroreductase family protein [Pseudonocardia]|uniref:Coenzyme F420:L-glutamate ligase n=2 Tax=Pseudonocardia TaxID=1847 RepID=A0A1Y2MPG1_PSEAH|nr:MULTISPECIES: nitroreductase family protein [Pseudonocardia]OSY37062.1 Coenzyme F420:L-glutamate ligase [Pseudonocardia autotrophica]TDN72035.1 nitroreductase [Pseudonocardia autotrophica]BBG02730.1 putative oxidoreductase [Pseudonocardia autotrophica]GEC25937.1 putative oxidoreductase [Pseudonocardia saturnea]
MLIDEALSTTRAVRRRLDATRDVPVELVRECVELAMQAPAGSAVARTRFVVVRDPERRRAVAEIYSDVYRNSYKESAGYIGKVSRADAEGQLMQERTARSADALERALHEVGTIVIGCLDGARLDGVPSMTSSSLLGGVLPAMWSFMLAGRARGLGTCWTTMHLARERDVAEALDIPFNRVQQVCLTPLAFTVGTDFRPASRPGADEVVHWDGWDADREGPAPIKGLLGPSTAPGTP